MNKKTGLLLLGALFAGILQAQDGANAGRQDSDVGFAAIFDGKTLDNWEGDPVYWRVENGCIVGEITPETVVKRNTFIIWKGGTPDDFELKVDYRISDKGNSGINYRSERMDDHPYALRGTSLILTGKTGIRDRIMKNGSVLRWHITGRK